MRNLLKIHKCLAIILIIAMGVGFIQVDVTQSMQVGQLSSTTINVIVLRVYFSDYTSTQHRYTRANVVNMFADINQLWQDTSYGKINISSQITKLYQLPKNRGHYIDDGVPQGAPPCDPDSRGDLSCGSKFTHVLEDAIDNSPSDLDWDNVDIVMALMSEDDPAQFHRGQGGSCNLPMGPGGKVKHVGCAIFSENPGENDNQIMGRWAHEMGHTMQQGGPAHPSNYNSEFELMDSNYPGQTGVFEKMSDKAFPGWLPKSKYKVLPKESGGGIVSIWAMEYPPTGQPNYQAAKIEITDHLYYLVSVRRRILGDDLNGDFNPFGIPDEGVLIERVVEGGNTSINNCAPTGECHPWVELMQPGSNPDDLWHDGDLFQYSPDSISIQIDQIDIDHYDINVWFTSRDWQQPDIALFPWLAPPGNTWETTDIWIDSPINGYGNYSQGWWTDRWGNLVPKLNGDAPTVGLVNRIYVRVRNLGTTNADNVAVMVERSDPPGMGIAGANGWAIIDIIDQDDFPELSFIPINGYRDVYVEWSPDFVIPEEKLIQGEFEFHTCIRVRLNHVQDETVFGNQDGDDEQENIHTFQATPEVMGKAFMTMINLVNDDLNNSKYFYLDYQNGLPEDWEFDINNGELGMMLEPGETRQIPVSVQPNGAVAVGSVYNLDIRATSQLTLYNRRNRDDRHTEFDALGGVRLQWRGKEPTEIGCTGYFGNWGSPITGRLTFNSMFAYPFFFKPLFVTIVGVDDQHKFIPQTATVVWVRHNGQFRGYLANEHVYYPREFACLFGGTTELATSASGYMSFK